MLTVTSTAFRQNVSSILDAVEKGETVQISRHGRVIAEMVPSQDTTRMPSWKEPGVRLAVKGASLTRAILAERRSGR
jgi:prevent-host-death family protein